MIGGGMAVLVGAPITLAVLIIVVSRLLGLAVHVPVVHGLLFLLGAAALKAALATDVRPDVLSEDAFVRVVVVTTAALGVGFAASNWRGRPIAARTGLAILLIGMLANAIPQTIDAAMPVSSAAARRAGYSEAELTEYVGYASTADGSTWRSLLGDVIPVVPLGKVISVGDILLAVGLVLFLAAITVHRPHAGTDDLDGPQARRQPMSSTDAIGATFQRDSRESPATTRAHRTTGGR